MVVIYKHGQHFCTDISLFSEEATNNKAIKLDMIKWYITSGSLVSWSFTLNSHP